MSGVDLINTADTQAWMQDARCAQAGPGYADEYLFPDRIDSHYSSKALAMCRNCPVRTQCLQLAIDTNQRWGLWGGLTPKERNTYRAARKDRTA